MHHPIPPSKTGWPSWFFHLWCASSWTTQNSDHPGNYWSNSRANLGNRRISAESIAEQLGISRERVGSIIHEDLDMQKLSAKWVPKCLNVDQKRQRCQSSEQLSEFFGTIQMISCRDWWPWTKPGYVTMTRRQSSNQRSGGIAVHPAPKEFRVQKSAGKILASIFFGSRRYYPHWLSSKGPNYQRGILLISAGAIEGHVEGKMPREVHQGGLVLARQCPGSPGTCNPEETGLPGLPLSWSPPYSPDLALRTTTCSLAWKNNWKVAIFRLTRGSLLPRRPGWTDNLLNFFFFF